MFISAYFDGCKRNKSAGKVGKRENRKKEDGFRDCLMCRPSGIIENSIDQSVKMKKLSFILTLSLDHSHHLCCRHFEHSIV